MVTQMPLKAIAQVFQDFSLFVRLVVGMGREFVFRKIIGGVTKLCTLNLLVFIELFL